MKILNKKAFAVIEYALLFILVIGAFLVMRSYIQRGLFGSWEQTGQTFAYGRQYDPQTTVECGFDDLTNKWYDRNCFKSQGCILGDPACESNCPNSSCNQLTNTMY